MIITTNRKARYDYEILAEIEAGIVLQGAEIKSIREKKMTIDAAYVAVEGKEAWLVGANIENYKFGNVEPDRKRKLLLHRKEIVDLSAKVAQKGLTIVPLMVFLKEGRAKIMIGLARGKKKYDKREAIKKREAERSIKNDNSLQRP